MRNFFTAAVILTAANGFAIACNCGSGGYAGGGSLGMLSQFNSSFVGLSWKHSVTESRQTGVAENDSNFQFNSVELAGKYFPVKRFFAAAIIPYRFNGLAEFRSRNSENGFGDMIVSAGYMALMSSDSICRTWNHSLALSAGVKMPTGKHGNSDNTQDIYLQPGTGSWDALFNAVYTFKYRKYGLLADVNYSVNTANKGGMELGNRFSASVNGFYNYRKGKISMVPSAGLLVENAAEDEFAGEVLAESGGSILLATAGLGIRYGKAGAGFSYQQPAYQNIADGSVRSKPGWMLQLSYIF